MSDDKKALSGEELYDSIMSQIEPELMLSNLPELKKLYKNEKPKQRTQRTLRYEKAFVQFDAMFDQMVLDPIDKLAVYEMNVMKKLGDNSNNGETPSHSSS